MEIDELKSRLVRMSDHIELLVNDFELVTGTTVAAIDLNRIATGVEMKQELNVNVRVEI